MWLIKVLRAFIPAMLGAGVGFIIAALFKAGKEDDSERRDHPE